MLFPISSNDRMNEIGGYTALHVVLKTLNEKTSLEIRPVICIPWYSCRRIVDVTGLSDEKLIHNASRGCIVPGCARRDGVQACGRISPESDENEIGGWRRQKEKKRRKKRERREGGSREDRETSETKGERRNRRERGKSFHRDRNERGCSIVFSPPDPERASLRRKHARTGSFKRISTISILLIYMR